MGLVKKVIQIAEEKALKKVISRAVRHCVDEKEVIRSQDKIVYTFIHMFYDERDSVRKKYRAYQRLRDYKVEKSRR